MTGSVERAGGPEAVEAKLRAVCRRALPALVDSSSGLIARGRIRAPEGWECTGPDLRDSAEVAHAAARLASAGARVPLDAEALREACRGRLEASDDVGTDELIWILRSELAAGSERAEPTAARLMRRWSPRESRTLRLAWGLLAALQWRAGGGDAEGYRRLVHRRLVANQDASTGLFRPSARRRGWARRRATEASLAAQVWGLTALLAHHRDVGDEESLASVLRGAETIVRAQGEDGQWWWKYDTRSGTVTEKYPVYSVHQDAAMPGLLRGLDRCLGEPRFEGAVVRGLRWITGGNETGRSLVDESAAVILRGVEMVDASPRVLEEMRSYHPARCLMALTPDVESRGV